MSAFSTKIHGNALVELVGAGMDGIGRFFFMLNASSSPSNTDQNAARYIIEVEANQGKVLLSLIVNYFHQLCLPNNDCLDNYFLNFSTGLYN